jgi:hypothetical protein
MKQPTSPCQVIGVIALVACFPLITCGGDDGDTLAGGAGAGATATGSGTGAGGFSPETCQPPCQEPQFCSVTGVCLDEGRCAHDDDCMLGAECDESGQCTGCAPPNMLIVLDRSCSMTSAVGNQTKWEIAVDAINTLTTDYVDTIRFGLSLFPDTEPTPCAQASIAIPVDEGNESAIQTLLTASLDNSDPNFPNNPCVTNIDTAMEQAAAEPAFDDATRPGYALLITDGKQYGCNDAGGDSGTTQIITDMYEQRGIPTFVIGFGDGVDPAQLNIFAEAGGMPTNDPTCSPDPCLFYKAEDAATLNAALDAIAASVSCDPEVH